jgi:hypothetical protein
MGFLDRLLGREPQPPARPDYGSPEPGGWSRRSGSGSPGTRSTRPVDGDAAAIERYRYLLRTAPPDAVEQAHREAFSQLTPEQRRQVLIQLGSQLPESERATSDDPQSLARMATRAEMRRPGTLERSFGGGMGGGIGMGGGGIGMGGLIAGSLLTSVAGAFVGTAIADAMFDASDSDSSDSADGDNGDSGDSGDSGGDDQVDAGDSESLDDGGGFDSAGDFGGGDFGDFGGGDF